MNRFCASIVLSTACLAGLTACDTVRAPAGPGLDQLPTENYPKVYINPPTLAKVMVITPGTVVVDTPADRPMSVTVPLRSIADNSMRVQYRFLWFDDKGRPVREGEWIAEMFAPRVERRLQGNAIDLKSRDWRLEVRSAL